MGMYLLRKLADEAALDRRGLLYLVSFVIIPGEQRIFVSIGIKCCFTGANPDGYEFSRNGNKMWRKTMKPVSSGCVGVDGNRNYDIHWLSGDQERFPCSDVYRGLEPFSESETRIVRNVMLRLAASCKMYISIHTYGNSILYPYGYTSDKHPQQKKLHTIAQAGVTAVKNIMGSTDWHAGQSGSRFLFFIIFSSTLMTNFFLVFILRLAEAMIMRLTLHKFHILLLLS